MKIFRSLLIIMFFSMLIYTIQVINIQGLLFLKYAVLTGWQGQFNYDFSCYLLLSAFWIIWRHNFTFKGILLGLIASVGGVLFFAPYLFIISLKTKGDMKELLIGKERLN